MKPRGRPVELTIDELELDCPAHLRWAARPASLPPQHPDFHRRHESYAAWSSARSAWYRERGVNPLDLLGWQRERRRGDAIEEPKPPAA